MRSGKAARNQARDRPSVTSLLEVSVTRRPRYRGPLLHANNRARPSNLARWQLEALLMLAYGKAHWKSAGVSFHENFWLAASAAGPVITLAIVVAIPDVANMRFRAAGAMRAAEDQRRVSEVSGPHDRPSRDSARDRAGESLRATRWAVQVTRWNVGLCYANLIA